MDSLDQKIIEHEFELKEIKAILGQVAQNQKTINDDIKVISAAVSKMDTVIERLGDFKQEIQSINERIRDLPVMQDRLNRLDSNITWLWRAILGGAITTLFMYFKGF